MLDCRCKQEQLHFFTSVQPLRSNYNFLDGPLKVLLTAMDARLTWAVNLVEILKEELEDAGEALPTDLTDQQLLTMPEAEIRAYYLHQQAPQHSSSSPKPAQLPQDQLARLQLQYPSQHGSAAFKAWFPSLSASRAPPLPAQPSTVVLCFHSSGNAEDMFTSEGTGSRRVQSALLEACRAHGWLLLAPQLPGRAQRLRDPPLSTLQEVAQQLLPLVVPALLSAGGRFAVVGHSMGCWAAYELMLALRQAGLPDPAVVCLSAMPSPHIPIEQRPWRQQKSLSEDEFKEECRAWDISEVVFSPGMWEMYQPLLRADFSLFDEYQPSNTAAEAQAAPFNSRLWLFWGERDRRVTKELLQGWMAYTTQPALAVSSCVAGNHLWPIAEPAAKAEWLSAVASALQEALL